MKRTAHGDKKPPRRFEEYEHLVVVMAQRPEIHFQLMMTCKSLEHMGNKTLENWVMSRSSELKALRVVFRKFQAHRINFERYQNLKNFLFPRQDFITYYLAYFDRNEDHSLVWDGATSMVVMETMWLPSSSPEFVSRMLERKYSAKSLGITEEEIFELFQRCSQQPYTAESILYMAAFQGYSFSLVQKMCKIFGDKPGTLVPSYMKRVEYPALFSEEIVVNYANYCKMFLGFRKTYFACIESWPANIEPYIDFIRTEMPIKQFLRVFYASKTPISPQIVGRIMGLDFYRRSDVSASIKTFYEAFCYSQNFDQFTIAQQVEKLERWFPPLPRNAGSVIDLTTNPTFAASYVIWLFRQLMKRSRFQRRIMINCFDRARFIGAEKLIYEQLEALEPPENVDMFKRQIYER
jgi:hypothetical protein